jgi:lipid II:glycine glycyltransferase (peptidoglycan interpeptide bridge formation enzyme)
MKVIEFTGDEGAWNEVLQGTLQPEAGLQALSWAKLKEETGWHPRNFAVLEPKNDNYSLICQVLQRGLPLGVTIWYAQRGPVWHGLPEQKSLVALTQHLRAEARGVSFLRFDPAVTDPRVAEWLEDLGFVKSFEEIQPRHSLLVSLKGTEEEILAQMHSKGRYNIRLSANKGVMVRAANDEEGLKVLNSLLRETAGRNKISVHPAGYYEKLMELLWSEGRGDILIAEHEGKPLAAIIVEYLGRYATYLHGASSSEGRNLMPTYLVQWEAMKRSKARGCEWYDLRGIGPEGEPNHPYAGLRDFKTKFGGEEVSYIGAYDLVLDPVRYAAYRSAQKLRKLIRVVH